MDFRFLNYIRRYSNPLRYWLCQYQRAKGLTSFSSYINDEIKDNYTGEEIEEIINKVEENYYAKKLDLKR